MTTKMNPKVKKAWVKAMRKQLMQMGNIKPAPAVPAMEKLQRQGHLACSHVDAILARRKELGKA